MGRSLHKCRDINDIIDWFYANKIDVKSRSKTNDQVLLFPEDIESAKQGNCIDVAVSSMCLLNDNYKYNGIAIITMQRNRTSKPTHWVAYSKVNGEFIVFNFISSNKINISKGYTLLSALEEQLEWMMVEYKKDFSVSLEKIYFDIVDRMHLDHIYYTYKNRQSITQSELISSILSS